MPSYSHKDPAERTPKSSRKGGEFVNVAAVLGELPAGICYQTADPATRQRIVNIWAMLTAEERLRGGAATEDAEQFLIATRAQQLRSELPRLRTQIELIRSATALLEDSKPLAEVETDVSAAEEGVASAQAELQKAQKQLDEAKSKLTGLQQLARGLRDAEKAIKPTDPALRGAMEHIKALEG